jgi:DNA invertase Pin-like site-specific DNA recombinase
VKLSEQQAEELLDVMRDHGWRETGPGYDPAQWLKDELGENRVSMGVHEEVEHQLRRALEDLEEERGRATAACADLVRVTRSLDEARDELADLRRQSARSATVSP